MFRYLAALALSAATLVAPAPADDVTATEGGTPRSVCIACWD